MHILVLRDGAYAVTIRPGLHHAALNGTSTTHLQRYFSYWFVTAMAGMFYTLPTTNLACNTRAGFPRRANAPARDGPFQHYPARA